MIVVGSERPLMSNEMLDQAASLRYLGRRNGRFHGMCRCSVIDTSCGDLDYLWWVVWHCLADHGPMRLVHATRTPDEDFGKIGFLVHRSRLEKRGYSIEQDHELLIASRMIDRPFNQAPCELEPDYNWFPSFVSISGSLSSDHWWSPTLRPSMKKLAGSTFIPSIEFIELLRRSSSAVVYEKQWNGGCNGVVLVMPDHMASVVDRLEAVASKVFRNKGAAVAWQLAPDWLR